METTLQDSLLKAISTVVDTRINDLALDKTVVCIIDKVLDSTKGSYRVKYDGGTFTAFSRNNDEIYQKGMAVLVQIPQNNMSNEKNIISRAWVNRGDIEDGIISPYLKNYVTIGNNVVINGINNANDEKGWSLCSFHPTDNTCNIEEHGSQEIYTDDGKNHSGSIDIRTQDLNVYLKNAVGLLIQADFSTNFKDENQENSSGNYGLCIKILKKSPYKQENYGKVLDSYKDKVIGKYLDSEASSSADAEQEVNLAEYINELESALAGNYKSTITINEETKEQIKIVGEVGYIDQEINKIKNLLSFYATENESIYKDIKLNIESYLIMLEEIRDNEDESLTGNYFYINYIYKWRQTVIEGSEETYYLSSNEMTGNPYNFSKSQQYIIIPATLNTFDRIESITFYKENFLEDITKEKPDIFVNNIEIFALEENLESNGGYQLKLTAKDGLIFDINDSEETVKNITAEVTRLYYEDLTNDTTFYWFKKSSKVKDSTHENYHQLGGLGWEIIKKNEIIYSEPNYPIHMSDLGLVAYDNVFKVVAKVNEEITLTQEFSIYNNKFKTNYRLVCSPGADLVSGDANVSILIESKVGSELKEIENLYLHDDNETNSEWLFSNNILKDQPTEYQYEWHLTEQIIEAEGTKKVYPIYRMSDNNNEYLDLSAKTEKEDAVAAATREACKKYATTIRFPVEEFINENSSLKVSCTINKFVPSKNDYSELGTATITLYRNSEGVAVSNYRIEIENGDQIFQYDEYGDAPNSNKLTNPIKIKPLIPHVYNRAGKEINSGSYSVTWNIPTEKTLITTKYPFKDEKNSVEVRQCEFDISPYYYSNYIENQIDCVIQFTSDDLKTEKTLYQRTNFLFTKVGNINTNGTEIVARITPIETRLPSYWNEPLTLYRYYEKTEKILRFNMGVQSKISKQIQGNDTINKINLVDNILKVQLFESNELIYDSTLDSLKNEATLTWGIIGGSNFSKHIKFDKNNGVPIWKDPAEEGLDNYILKATVNYNGKNYYAFYPIYYIEYNDNQSKSIFKDFITINNQKLLKEIIYNSQGLNPTYDPDKDEKGIYLTFKNFYNKNSGLTQGQRNNITITWEATGSKILDGGKTSAFFSILDPPSKITQEGNDGVASIKIKPDSQYIGGCGDNIVKATIKSGNSVLVTIYIPIYMGLNRFELESLNDWDGNSVVVDPDTHTEILAPQIGAGKKDANNRFTGILMGQKNTYNYNDSGRRQTTDSYTGLFGYRDGLQSIFLDAETGNAIFGLPEGYTLNNKNEIISENTTDDYSEGRIEIRPGGISTVGGWRIGRKSLYYALDNKNEVPTELEFSNNNNKDHFKHNLRGILLESGERPRIIIKSREWTSEDVGTKNSEYDVAAEATSFELNIDPNKRDFFNLYRHYLQGDEWKIQPLVGIDANGKFFTNSLQDKRESNLSIGPVSAFNSNASTEDYFGLNLVSGSRVIFKAFVKTDPNNNQNGKIIKADSILHISGGASNSEYDRPIEIHGKKITLYSEKELKNYFMIEDNTAELKLDNTFNLKLGETKDNDNNINYKVNLNLGSNPNSLFLENKFNVSSNDIINLTSNIREENSNSINLGNNSRDNKGIELNGVQLNGTFKGIIDFENKGNISFITTQQNNETQILLKQVKNETINGKETEVDVAKLKLTEQEGLIHLGNEDTNNLIKLSSKNQNQWNTNQNIKIEVGNNGTKEFWGTSARNLLVDTDSQDNQIALIAKAKNGNKEYNTILYLNSHKNQFNQGGKVGHPFSLLLAGGVAAIDATTYWTGGGSSGSDRWNVTKMELKNFYISSNKGIKIDAGDCDPTWIPNNTTINYSGIDHHYQIRLDTRYADTFGQGDNARDYYGAIQSNIIFADYFGNNRNDNVVTTFEGGLFKGKGTESDSAKYEGNEFKGVTFKGWGDTGSNSAKYEGNEFKGVTFKGWDTSINDDTVISVGSAKYYGDATNLHNTSGSDSAIGTVSTTNSGEVGGYITVNIPEITVTNGRPSFSLTGSETFYSPDADTIVEAIKDDSTLMEAIVENIKSDLKTYFDGIYTSKTDFGKHIHKFTSNDATRYMSKVKINNTSVVTGISDQLSSYPFSIHVSGTTDEPAE